MYNRKVRREKNGWKWTARNISLFHQDEQINFSLIFKEFKFRMISRFHEQILRHSSQVELIKDKFGRFLYPC